MSPLPELQLFNHQDALDLDLDRLEAAGRAALSEVLKSPGPEEPALPRLPEIEITFVDDAVISRVHAEFLDDPTPTDVITFEHGEILISTETALRQAPEHGQPPLRETALYLIHGLLHLNGHEDHTETGRGTMQRLQETILDQVWPR
ncbi:MAG: rRNA maturation RNase YbeY [Verrucomicrobiaceae bacterium]|nr:MAG: rRNA maturation RNase YbeY [Verrucomicrobiaceae bacterium]